MSQQIHLDEPSLGKTSGELILDNRAIIRDFSARLANQAQRELLLFGPTIDPEIYDQQPFLNGIQRLALSRPHFPVRILICEPGNPGRTVHRLIEQARRMTSRIAIRRIDEEDQDRLDAFLIADERGYIRRRLADRLEAVADFNNPRAARQLRKAFEHLWERSISDTESRRLFL